MSIIKDENQLTMIVMSGTEYNNITKKIVKELSSRKVIYITLNKTTDALKETFSKAGINIEKFLFLDCISKTIKSVDNTEDAYYISSPAALTELSLALTKLTKGDFEYVVFDSITNLLTYSPKTTVIKFITFLINNIRESDTKAVFYMLDIEEYKQVLQECGTMMDETITPK